MRRGVSALDVAAVGALGLAGLAFRLPGLTTRDLWFDDAWAALPARVGLSDAVHMVVTTPLWTLSLRSWIRIAPHETWWAQLPALVLGVAGIVAAYALVRALGLPRVAAFAAGAVIAAGPITITYSTRVKEYSADLVLACLVLWLAERWRREPGPRRLAWLGAAGAVAIWTSASTAAVVGGAAAMAVLVAWDARPLRRQVAALVGTLGVAALLDWVVFLRDLPRTLRINWTTHGFLFGYRSARHAQYSFQQTFSGLAHGLFGVPIAYTFHGYALRTVPMAIALLTVVVLLGVIVPPLHGAIRSRGAAVSPAVASAAAVALAVIGTLATVAPLGDGRTDEALYPALLVVTLFAARALARRARAAWRGPLARVVLAAAVAVVALAYGVTHSVHYPPTGLRTVLAELRPVLEPGDVVVVDGYESFTYGYEDQGPWAVSFHQAAVPWPMGFHVASLDREWVLSRNYLQPDAQIAALPARTTRTWFVGPNVGGYSTSAPKPLWNFGFQTPTMRALLRKGWRPSTICCHSSGTYAQLYTQAR